MNDKFFPELARRLKRAGISTGLVERERLPVLLDGQEVMAVAPGGTIFLMPETADTQPVVDAYGTVAGISAQVHEYTEAMAAAPPLAAEGLHEGFRLLAEFNGVVLAGQELEGTWGYKFVTWARSPDRAAVAHGHYYDGGDSYEAAKLDFACRAGLVDEHRQFTDEQLTELYRCIHETLDSEYPMTAERQKLLTGISEQLQRAVDDLDERVSLSNQRELEAAEQHGPEMPGDIHNQGGMRFEYTEKTAGTPQGAGKSYTVEELLTLMGPEFQRQKDVMRQCIAGLTEYAAQLAVWGQEEQLPRLRRVCVEMAEFWGLAEEDTPEGVRNMAEQYGSAFDRAVSTARGAGCAPGLGEQAIQNTLAGLELYARELRANDEGLEDWAVECEILADDLEEFAAQSRPEELEAAEQQADSGPGMGMAP